MMPPESPTKIISDKAVNQEDLGLETRDAFDFSILEDEGIAEIPNFSDIKPGRIKDQKKQIGHKEQMIKYHNEAIGDQDSVILES